MTWILTYDWANRKTQCTPSTVLCYMWQVGLSIKSNGLVPTVITSHVALATVDTKIFINHSYHLLTIVQVTITANTTQRQPDDILCQSNSDSSVVKYSQTCIRGHPQDPCWCLLNTGCPLKTGSPSIVLKVLV